MRFTKAMQILILQSVLDAILKSSCKNLLCSTKQICGNIVSEDFQPS